MPHFDVQIPLLSLPGIFKTKPETVPDRVPYIGVPERACVPLPDSGYGLKVGVVWAGSPANPCDSSRSICLVEFKTLFEITECVFYSLQYGDLAKQISEEDLGSKIRDLSPLIEDFATTASFVSQLDLVISVCTSVAHLAGSMGVETWILLSEDADWRWMRERDDSPWYPSVRLFRKSNLDSWGTLVDQVAKALNSRVST